MVGTINSGNKYSIPINPDGELGEAMESVILPSGYGSATFIMKEFMEKHRDELIGFWNKQGKDGKAVFDKWLSKWSMTRAEQDAVKDAKAKEEHDKLVNQYVKLGETKESAEEFASLFPDSNPLDILRGKNYNIQNKPIENSVEAKNVGEIVKLQEKLSEVTIELKRNEDAISRNITNPEIRERIELRIPQLKETRTVLENRLAELKQREARSTQQHQPNS
jgi:hypothetical protein